MGDITYISTKERTLYLPIFMDIFSRKVVVWSMGNRMKDTLVIKVFNQAYGKEHPPKSLIVHTDHGYQYTGGSLKKYASIHSNSRKGNPYDNVIIESFYRTIKRELIQDSHYKTLEQAQKEIFKYIIILT
ncbi:MAG: DDE-type integrase/transposase/recombinase [Clostridium butyricum]|nr:DDE-type integrase/transposase/recombinase [Clostridium butyricum]MDU4853767.1 DDE-type integrase/transposase/recombinase [Clostridioides difficile]